MSGAKLSSPWKSLSRLFIRPLVRPHPNPLPPGENPPTYYAHCALEPSHGGRARHSARAVFSIRKARRARSDARYLEVHGQQNRRLAHRPARGEGKGRVVYPAFTSTESLWRTGVCLLVHAAVLLGGITSHAEDQSTGQDRIRQAVQIGLKTLERSGAEYPEQRTCFSCHHQTLPMQAMVVAREHGFKIDDELLRAQTKLTLDTFKARRTNLNDGTGIGGRSMTVGFGLWALDLGAWETDDTTSAMIRFLLKDQAPDGHFSSNVSRPPLEDSVVTSTTVAAYYMRKFTPAGQKAEVDRAVNSAKQWLIRTRTESQEDRNSKLWGLNLLNGEEEQVEQARKAVLESQRTDGGWAQLASMESDAYATGQTLFILQKTGTPVSHPAYQRGVGFLVETQLQDGTWYVKTRSKPIQTYFESGFPHGTDQFISICATSWAVAALAGAHSP